MIQSQDMSEEAPVQFSSTLPIIIYTRPVGQDIDWQEFDRGPGYFSIPPDQEIRVRIKSINDEDLATVIKELEGVSTLRFLDLAENRNVTNESLIRLKSLPQLTGLNLSSCSINSTGFAHLRALPHLTYLNLSYCNKLTDPALKTMDAMKNLTFVDIRGCLGFTQRGFSQMHRRNLTISR